MPDSIAGVGRHVLPYRLWIGRPVLLSVVEPILTSDAPRMPCSGSEQGNQLDTRCAEYGVDGVLLPSAVRPVWLVIRPTRLPLRMSKFLAAKNVDARQDCGV